MDKDVEFAMKRIKDIEKARGKPKQIIFANAEEAGFLIKCLKCDSTIISIVPTMDKEGQGIILWCMKCENTMMFGAKNPQST